MDKLLEKLDGWINESTIEPDIKAELIELKKNNDYEEISDRFYKDMAFGTGGLRGELGAGTNRMNIHTVRRLSQAFADFLISKSDSPSVVIAYDNRHNSDRFAFEAACVYAANGISVSLFEKLTPTPMLSYAVRALKAEGGIVITASHNPKEYNGYKIYDNEGCQCLPEESVTVANIMENTDMFAGIKTCAGEYQGHDTNDRIKNAVDKNELLKFVPERINNDYYEEVLSNKSLTGNIDAVSAVFTPLNGTGADPVKNILNKAGIGHLNTVDEQMAPDPDFATCPQPNPEEDEALEKGVALCKKLNKEGNAPDLLLATDPDCDRVGVMVKYGDDFVRVDGNQIGVLLFDFIVNLREEYGHLPEKPVMITTVVSTPMAGDIAYKKRIHTDRVMTGFKFIGAKIAEYEAKGQADRFLFAFEESCGYLAGTYVRDKDAVSASLLIAEMTGYYKNQKKTLVDRLNELYAKYGYYITKQKSFKESGKEGTIRINKIMDTLRMEETLNEFSFKVVEYLDYEKQTKRSMGLYDDDEGGCAMAIGTKPIMGLSKENVLEFNFSNRCKAIIRPSGTEPKIKIYLTSRGESVSKAQKMIETIESEFIKVVKSV